MDTQTDWSLLKWIKDWLLEIMSVISIAFIIMSCLNRSVMSQVLTCKVQFWLPPSCTCSFSLLPCHVCHMTDTLTYSTHVQNHCRPVGRQSDVTSSHHKRAMKPSSWTHRYTDRLHCPKSSHLPSFTFSYLLRQVLMMEPPSLPLLLHNPTLPLSLFLFLSPSVSLSVSLSPPLSLSPFLSLSQPNRWRQRVDDHWVWFCWRFLPVKKDNFSCYCRPALAHGRNVGSL